MKLLIEPKDTNLDRFISLGYDSFLIGIKDLSNNIDNAIPVDEILELRDKYKDIKLFIVMNKNIFNNELGIVLEVLEKLNNKIDGLLFYDLSILRLVKKNNLNIPLVWNQTYMVTNYNTCNYYKEMGCEYALLASEITIDEIKEIREKSNIKLMLNIFGYPVMSHSNRKLISNYFNFINKEKEKNKYTITEVNKDTPYIVKEDKTGTSFLYGNLLNGTSALIELKDLDIDYVIAREDVDSDLFYKVLDNFNSIINNNYKDDIVDEMNKLIGEYTGFFYKKSIYKVKKGA